MEAGPDRPRVGVDDWVASVDDRIEDRVGFGKLGRKVDRLLPPWARLGLFLAFAATLPLWMGTGDLFAYGIFTLIYIMLGLGLNVVVA